LHIRVCIVSNTRLHREGLAALLRECPSIEVLGAVSVQEAQNAPPAAATDVALVDLLPPGDIGLSRRRADRMLANDAVHVARRASGGGSARRPRRR
jgi:DNA-binding NarL/FixJ family response regulator